MEDIHIHPFITLTVGFIVFFRGVFLTRHVRFLQDYNIPEPVSGGMAVAVMIWVYYLWTGDQVEFDLRIRDYLLVMFFATIGLNARIADLFSGGRLLLILLALTLMFILLQNCIGLLGTMFFDLPKPVSVLLGSASLIGGHGTAIAWGPQIEEMTGMAGASEIGIAVATLGLICAALIGGPIAKRLIDRDGLKADETASHLVGLEREMPGHAEDMVNHISLMRGMLAAHVAILLGYLANELILDAGLKLPLFVPCLIVGILMSNTIPYVFPRMPWPARTKGLAVISDYCLSVFLAISLMSMKLWTIADLGLTLFSVLVLQVVVAAGFILFIGYRLMGANYRAAVLSAGFAGFALGATPTAIANMSSVTKRYGPAPLAFIILTS